MSSHHKYKLADTFETLCEIWNLKFTICNLQFKKCEKHPWRSDKVTLLLKGFSRFLKPTNCTKLRKAPYLFQQRYFSIYDPQSWKNRKKMLWKNGVSEWTRFGNYMLQ